MQLHWDALIQGTTTGLVGAAVIGLLSLGRRRVRDAALKREITKDLDSMGIGSGLSGVTTTVRNRTGYEMTVRQVMFLIGGTYMVLLPTGELSSSFKGESRKLTKTELRRLKKGEAVQMEAQMQFQSWKVPPGQAGFVTLPPYTKTGFVLPANFVANSNEPIAAVRVVLEYTTRALEKKSLSTMSNLRTSNSCKRR
jgi:hypothetical protein